MIPTANDIEFRAIDGDLVDFADLVLPLRKFGRLRDVQLSSRLGGLWDDPPSYRWHDPDGFGLGDDDGGLPPRRHPLHLLKDAVMRMEVERFDPFDRALPLGLPRGALPSLPVLDELTFAEKRELRYACSSVDRPPTCHEAPTRRLSDSGSGSAPPPSAHRLCARFNHVDSDRDGRITPTELRLTAADSRIISASSPPSAAGTPSEGTLGALSDLLDLDRDDAISLPELDEACRQLGNDSGNASSYSQRRRALEPMTPRGERAERGEGGPSDDSLPQTTHRRTEAADSGYPGSSKKFNKYPRPSPPSSTEEEEATASHLAREICFRIPWFDLPARMRMPDLGPAASRGKIPKCCALTRTGASDRCASAPAWGPVGGSAMGPPTVESECQCWATANASRASIDNVSSTYGLCYLDAVETEWDDTLRSPRPSDTVDGRTASETNDADASAMQKPPLGRCVYVYEDSVWKSRQRPNDTIIPQVRGASCWVSAALMYMQDIGARRTDLGTERYAQSAGEQCEDATSTLLMRHAIDKHTGSAYWNRAGHILQAAFGGSGVHPANVFAQHALSDQPSLSLTPSWRQLELALQDCLTPASDDWPSGLRQVAMLRVEYQFYYADVPCDPTGAQRACDAKYLTGTGELRQKLRPTCVRVNLIRVLDYEGEAYETSAWPSKGSPGSAGDDHTLCPLDAASSWYGMHSANAPDAKGVLFPNPGRSCRGERNCDYMPASFNTWDAYTAALLNRTVGEYASLSADLQLWKQNATYDVQTSTDDARLADAVMGTSAVAERPYEAWTGGHAIDREVLSLRSAFDVDDEGAFFAGDLLYKRPTQPTACAPVRPFGRRLGAPLVARLSPLRLHLERARRRALLSRARRLMAGGETRAARAKAVEATAAAAEAAATVIYYDCKEEEDPNEDLSAEFEELPEAQWQTKFDTAKETVRAKLQPLTEMLVRDFKKLPGYQQFFRAKRMADDEEETKMASFVQGKLKAALAMLDSLKAKTVTRGKLYRRMVKAAKGAVPRAMVLPDQPWASSVIIMTAGAFTKVGQYGLWGTVLHETMHLVTVSSDYAYGEDPAFNLACDYHRGVSTQSPRFNADSYVWGVTAMVNGLAAPDSCPIRRQLSVDSEEESDERPAKRATLEVDTCLTEYDAYLTEDQLAEIDATLEGQCGQCAAHITVLYDHDRPLNHGVVERREVQLALPSGCSRMLCLAVINQTSVYFKVQEGLEPPNRPWPVWLSTAANVNEPLAPENLLEAGEYVLHVDKITVSYHGEDRHLPSFAPLPYDQALRQAKEVWGLSAPTSISPNALYTMRLVHLYGDIESQVSAATLTPPRPAPTQAPTHPPTQAASPAPPVRRIACSSRGVCCAGVPAAFPRLATERTPP